MIHLHGDPFPGEDIEVNSHGPAGGKKGSWHDEGRARCQDDRSCLPDAPANTQDDACKDSGNGIGSNGPGDGLPLRPTQRVTHFAEGRRNCPD